MNILLVVIIFITIVIIRKLWIEYKDKENSFRKINQAIDQKLLNKNYMDLEDSRCCKFGNLLFPSSKKLHSIGQICINKLQTEDNFLQDVLYTSMFGEKIVEGIPIKDNCQAYKVFQDDINKCQCLHNLIFFHFESNNKRNCIEENSNVVTILKQDIENTLSFLHDLYEEQDPIRFRYVDVNKFKSDEFERYLQLKLFYFWLKKLEQEFFKKNINKSKTSKSISKKETSDETKSTEKESNNGVTNAKRRRTRTSNSNTKKSIDSKQKDIQ